MRRCLVKKSLNTFKMFHRSVSVDGKGYGNTSRIIVFEKCRSHCDCGSSCF